MMLAGTASFIIRHVIPTLPKRGRMLCIARMSMNWDIDEVIEHLRGVNVTYNKDAAERIRQHNSGYTSKEFFELFDFERFDDLDTDPSEGCSIIHNLNDRLPEQLVGEFDFVLENGTIEHVFDMKTAMGNIARALKVGGTICHVSPLDAFNHGFYNFSVNFFNDFYRANGFEDRKFFLCRAATRWVEDQNVLVEPFPYTHEEFYIRPEVYQSPYNKLALAFVATKRQHFNETVIPTQAAYDDRLRLPSVLNWINADGSSNRE